jgi:ABC-type branched-subunit amino acid transport system ATPase component/branched-subunit amino acid ABC-type transport system permease component
VSEFLPYIVAGLAAGAIYGLAGTGLVISYKTSGIFNFAHPALAAVAAYAFYFLHGDSIYFNAHLSWPLSAAIAVLVVGPLMGLVMELIVRGLAGVATSLQVLATIGLSLGVIGALGLFYQNQSGLTFDPYLPQGSFGLFGTNVGWDQFILFVFGGLSVAGLYVFFRTARLGKAMRGVVDNPDLVNLTGTSSTVVRRWAWLIGSTFAAASGVLLAPAISSLNANAFFLLIISSFGAAAIGRFRSLPLTFFGGLIIGILGSLSSKYETSVSWLSGVNPAFPFIVLLIVLIVTKRSKLLDTRVGRPRPTRQSYYAPWRVRLVAGIVATTLLALVPQMVGRNLALWGSGLTYMILLLSLGLLVKESGQVSLCQTGFAAVGGVAFVHSAAQWGFPWFVALLFAGVVAAAVGLVVAIPAIRVSGVFLALGTLGFGLALQSLVYPTSIMFTHSTDGLPNVPRPSFASGDKGFYYVMLACTLITALAMLSIRFGRLGRLLRGLADSPLALNTMGTSVNATRVIVFGISAFFAGIAGALYGSFFQGIGLETPLFQPVLALQLFAIVMLVGIGTPWFALAGALGLAVLPGYFTTWFTTLNVQPYLSLLFGLSAVLIAIQADRAPGAPRFVVNFSERFRTARPPATVVQARPRPAGDALRVEGITVRFGGIVAVSSLTLEASFGRITGLIGPNGAGKTTTFNACSGLTRPSDGLVRYQGRDISGMSPAARARLGIGRTFQQAELWDSLTVRENIALGSEAPLAGASYLAQLAARPGERDRIDGVTGEAMEITGITDLADRRVGDLSTGQRRLVELARVLAGPFDLLLLDEPSSGLDKTETERFGAVLQRIVRDRGTGIFLVEHDMHLVMAICEYIYVMDFGLKIYEGIPAEVATSDVVRAAYLGSEDVTPLPAAAPVEMLVDGKQTASP